MLSIALPCDNFYPHKGFITIGSPPIARFPSSMGHSLPCGLMTCKPQIRNTFSIVGIEDFYEHPPRHNHHIHLSRVCWRPLRCCQFGATWLQCFESKKGLELSRSTASAGRRNTSTLSRQRVQAVSGTLRYGLRSFPPAQCVVVARAAQPLHHAILSK